LSKFKQRLALKMQEMLREGKHRQSRVPYGYRWDYEHKRPAPDEEKFPILKEWCRRILTESTYALGQEYHIHPGQIAQVLHNPVICGYPCRRQAPHNGRKARTGEAWKSSHERVPRDRWDWPEKPGGYAAACTLPEWEAIQAAIAARKCSRSATASTDGWCRRLLRFHPEPTVGVPIPGRVFLGRRFRTEPTYCLYHADGRRSEILRAPVHDAATEALAQLFDDPERLADAWQRGLRPPEESRAPAIQADIEAQRRLLDRIALAELSATDPEHQGSLARNREAIQQELRRLQRELNANRAAPPPPELPFDLLRDAGRCFAATWEATPDAERLALAQACLTAIHFHFEPQPGRRPSLLMSLGADYAEWTEVSPLREKKLR
jgi:hypothetical protein